MFAPVSSPSAKVTATAVPVLSIITRLAISSELRLWVISKLPSAVKSAFTNVPEKYCKQFACTGGVEITEKSASVSYSMIKDNVLSPLVNSLAKVLFR